MPSLISQPTWIVIFPLLFVLILFCAVSPLLAQRHGSSTAAQEISHLLDFIEESGCVFVRNNKSYEGKRAREHITGKYEYLMKREKKISAEQFIKYAASRSSLSKKPYTVHCGGASPVLSEQWLSEELKRWRQSR